jgi:hypothetical protein
MRAHTKHNYDQVLPWLLIHGTTFTLHSSFTVWKCKILNDFEFAMLLTVLLQAELSFVTHHSKGLSRLVTSNHTGIIPSPFNQSMSFSHLPFIQYLPTLQGFSINFTLDRKIVSVELHGISTQ